MDKDILNQLKSLSGNEYDSYIDKYIFKIDKDNKNYKNKLEYSFLTVEQHKHVHRKEFSTENMNK